MEGGAGRGEGEAASQGTGVEGVPLYSNLYQPTWIFRMCDAQWCRLKGAEPPALVSKSWGFLLLFRLTRNNETLSPKWGLPVLKYWPEMTNPSALFTKGCNYSQVASHSFVGSFSSFSSFFFPQEFQLLELLLYIFIQVVEFTQFVWINLEIPYRLLSTTLFSVLLQYLTSNWIQLCRGHRKLNFPFNPGSTLIFFFFSLFSFCFCPRQPCICFRRSISVPQDTTYGCSEIVFFI